MHSVQSSCVGLGNQIACDTRALIQHKGVWRRAEHNAPRELTACGGEWRYGPRIELHIDSASSKPAKTPGFCRAG